MWRNKASLSMLVFVAALFFVPIVFSGNNYLLLLFCTAGVSTIAVSGLDVLFGYSGQISLGHAAFYAMGAYTSAILSTAVHLPVWLTLVVGGIFSTILGIFIALPASKLVHHFLALLTIALGQLVYLVVSYAVPLTGGFTGLNNIPAPNIGPYVLNTNTSFYYIIIGFTLLFMVIKQRIVNSRIGRALIAIRENAHAANGMGINVRYYKVMAFAISAFFTGFAGGLYAHLVGFISPETFGFSQSVVFLVMLLFGGTGSLLGPIIGVVVLTIAAEYLQAVGSYQSLVYGLFLLVCIMFLPKGVYGVVDILKGQLERAVKTVAKA